MTLLKIVIDQWSMTICKRHCPDFFETGKSSLTGQWRFCNGSEKCHWLVNNNFVKGTVLTFSRQTYRHWLVNDNFVKGTVLTFSRQANPDQSMTILQWLCKMSLTGQWQICKSWTSVDQLFIMSCSTVDHVFIIPVYLHKQNKQSYLLYLLLTWCCSSVDLIFILSCSTVS